MKNPNILIIDFSDLIKRLHDEILMLEVVMELLIENDATLFGE